MVCYNVSGLARCGFSEEDID